LTLDALSDPVRDAAEYVRRYLFGTFALVFGLNALLLASNQALPAGGRALLVTSTGALCLLCLAALRWQRVRTEAVLVGVCAAALGLIAASAVLNGWGMNGPVIGFIVVLSFLIGAVVSARLGAALGAVGIALLLGLAWAEHQGWIRGVVALTEVSLQRRLANLLLVLAVGISCGLTVRRVFDHFLGASRDREQRFQRLLGIAVDTYWEMDRDFTQTRIWARGPDAVFVPRKRTLKAPWDHQEWAYDPGVAEAHFADLRAHRPFRDVRVRWRGADGAQSHLLVSGEPRFDADGCFRGYWGVTRNIDDLVHTQEQLRRSEATLSALVATSPDMITLTELATGRYVMVNDAFTRVTGYTREEALGRTSVELGVWVSQDDREAFVRRLREDGRVQDLAVRFLDKHGRDFALLISAAVFELEGRSCMVLNGRDVSEGERTRLAHEAVLANASLGIAFTREGRFVQANPALEKMLDWAPGTLVGQPGRVVWASDEEYAEIGALIGPTLARGESVEFVRELHRRGGGSFWCRMLARAVDPGHSMRGGTIWIVEDITERRRTEQALAKARDDAEAASRAKSAFLANTSHEIRTPLNGLVGLARLARRPGLDDARRSQYLEQIAESAQTLSAIISDVLDLSRIEAGKLGLEEMAFDLHALLESLRQVYATLADARGLGFRLQRSAEVPQWVWGDPVRVRQVLGNYLSNALKFTAQGSVTLRVSSAGTESAGQRLRFEVHDTGPGVAPEARERLFRPFEQADQSITRRFGGSGLGLSICRELATLMHGEVGLHSTPGQGSCFWAELPLPATAAGAAAADPLAEGAQGLAGARVLMVEDNPVNMTIAVAMLEHWGVEVAQAGDGAQAIAAVEQAERGGRPLDLVLMDVQMPVMSGYEATRALRARPASRHLPIIALTAAALSSERDEALAAGMDGFLTKPIDVRKLHDTLAATLARRA
jgi:PAS domain S-box-containing protein